RRRRRRGGWAGEEARGGGRADEEGRAACEGGCRREGRAPALGCPPEGPPALGVGAVRAPRDEGRAGGLSRPPRAGRRRCLRPLVPDRQDLDLGRPATGDRRRRPAAPPPP